MSTSRSSPTRRGSTLSEDEAAKRALDYVEEWWGRAAAVRDVEHRRTWWGRARHRFRIACGLPRAHLLITVDGKTGAITNRDHVAYPVPLERLPEISHEEALAIAREEADRLGWMWDDEARVLDRGDIWIVARNPLEWIGGGATYSIHRRTGVLVHRWPGSR